MTWKMYFKLIYSSVHIFTTVDIRTRTHLMDVCGCVHAYMFVSFGFQGFFFFCINYIQNSLLRSYSIIKISSFNFFKRCLEFKDRRKAIWE